MIARDVAWFLYYVGVWSGVRRDLELSLVERGDLELSLVEDGDLECKYVIDVCILAYDIGVLSGFSPDFLNLCIHGFGTSRKGCMRDVSAEGFDFFGIDRLWIYRDDGTGIMYAICDYIGLVPFVSLLRSGFFKGDRRGIAELIRGCFSSNCPDRKRSYWVSRGTTEGSLSCIEVYENGYEICEGQDLLRYKAWMNEIVYDIYDFMFDFVG